MTKKLLSGVRVLDFTRVLAGPYLTQLICDMGAEVIKIEQPGVGADERHLPPFKNGKSGYFMMLNRGKKSITLNVKSPKGKEIIRELVKQSDIVTENFAPGVMKKLGFAYEDLKKIKPDIIMCSISAFGQAGPYANKVGYDITAQALSGLMWMTGDIDRPPTRSGTSIGDVVAGAHALGALMAALYYREKTGIGQHVDISLRDCLTAILETGVIRTTLSDGKDKVMRSGHHHAIMAPYGVFDAGKENYVIVAAMNDATWSRLCTVLKREELANDPLWNSVEKRGKVKDKLIPMIEGWLQSFPDVNEALAILEENRVPSALVLNLQQVVNDPQLLSRNMIAEVDDPVCGKVKLPATPMVLSETSVINTEHAPELGENTAEVLKKYLNMDDSAIADLHKENVI